MKDMTTDKTTKPEKNDSKNVIDNVTGNEYKYGFTTDIDTDIIPGTERGCGTVHIGKKGEPEWLLEFRLKAFRHWLTLTPPEWAHLDIPEIDFQAISYYAAPKVKENPKSLDEVDPELLDTFSKLGISLDEQKNSPVWLWMR